MIDIKRLEAKRLAANLLIRASAHSSTIRFRRGGITGCLKNPLLVAVNKFMLKIIFFKYFRKIKYVLLRKFIL